MEATRRLTTSCKGPWAGRRLHVPLLLVVGLSACQTSYVPPRGDTASSRERSESGRAYRDLSRVEQDLVQDLVSQLNTCWPAVSPRCSERHLEFGAQDATKIPWHEILKVSQAFEKKGEWMFNVQVPGSYLRLPPNLRHLATTAPCFLSVSGFSTREAALRANDLVRRIHRLFQGGSE